MLKNGLRWVSLMSLALGATGCSGDPESAETGDPTDTVETVDTEQQPLLQAYTEHPISAVQVGNYIWVFARSASNLFARRVYSLSTSSWVGAWESIDTDAIVPPVVVTYGPGTQVSAYYIGVGNRLWEYYYGDASNPSNPGAWVDVLGFFPGQFAQGVDKYLTAAGDGDEATIATHNPQVNSTVFIQWNAPGAPGTYSGPLNDSAGVAASMDSGALEVATVRGSHGTSFFDRGLMTAGATSYGNKGTLQPSPQSNVGTTVVHSGGVPIEARLFAVVNGKMNRRVIAAGDTTLGSWSAFGNCASADGDPAIGRENSLAGTARFPYFPMLSNIANQFVYQLAASEKSTTCAGLGGKMLSAPTVVTVRQSSGDYKDFVFYSGIVERGAFAFMYTRSGGHVNLGLQLQ